MTPDQFLKTTEPKHFTKHQHICVQFSTVNITNEHLF
jgi:hypothetical protein